MTTQFSAAPTAVKAMSVMRMFAGAFTWASPAASWTLFGLGPIHTSDGSFTISRLFGVRDLALGLAVLHENPDVRRTALRAGIAIDAADVAANLLGVRSGAPRTSLLGVAAGAGLFVALGVVGLKQE